MNNITVKNLGQLHQADIEFGDLTILVGPQASAKSIFLQLVKLTLDHSNILRTIRQYGFDWQQNHAKFLTLYFGEGMQGLWTSDTHVQIDGVSFNLEKSLSARGKKKQEEQLFLIPAQRVITLRNGWPRPFTDYDSGDPYVVRQFSERLRLLMEAGLGGGRSPIFPQEGRLNEELRNAINQSIFSNAEVRLDTTHLQRRIVLRIDGNNLPFMVWSAGQREFIPLLLGLYALMPSGRTAKSPDIDWVVIEEPEMGLHPQAISALLMLVLELLHRGYKVILSTHSPQVLELVWAVRLLAEMHSQPENILRLFDLRKDSYLQKMAETVLRKTYKTYYFDRREGQVNAVDISTLDPSALEDAVADWGGLTEFSTRVSQIISEVVRQNQGE